MPTLLKRLILAGRSAVLFGVPVLAFAWFAPAAWSGLSADAPFATMLAEPTSADAASTGGDVLVEWAETSRILNAFPVPPAATREAAHLAATIRSLKAQAGHTHGLAHTLLLQRLRVAQLEFSGVNRVIQDIRTGQIPPQRATVRVRQMERSLDRVNTQLEILQIRERNARHASSFTFSLGF